MQKDFSPLEQSLGISFDNKDFLVHAFVHRSYLNENPDSGLEHNERLEFLGDAVLELVVTEKLYQQYPSKPEGELTTWRAALVNAKILSEIARSLKFNDFLLLSRGEGQEEGKARDYILANTMESFIGALYLDQGLKVCEKFIEEHILSRLPAILSEKLFEDAKSRFQELAQEKMGATPTYQVINEWGPDHQKNFRVGALIGSEVIAEGRGTSKQEAEQDAASQALKKKHWN
ncbi:MAG: ribonuclease III [Candidatus Wildermuthbacteria bacterium RIFCSPHIGHO2_02_FULL_47_12]|uniref:Ribonuclease 3 n=2 Tax=Parcubacteria group TaxID=1794811 RepID=A0A1G2R2X1_9BACT|nr:MAG: ribonuclease III [Candidatus Buchananbacteria bacterium RIFCSPLOWO2_01_FULL_46_12]OHA66602.1 MAG: ribonuclease III [Candidatus Wildermuthbacteria bacterium RIFCSPHIGHO2_02_FULL_47_12]